MIQTEAKLLSKLKYYKQKQTDTTTGVACHMMMMMMMSLPQCGL